MRRYIVTFWEPVEKSWPTVEGRLQARKARYGAVVISKGTVTIECPEETALLLRDDEAVHSLLIARP
jgi:hypothetical protein